MLRRCLSLSATMKLGPMGCTEIINGALFEKIRQNIMNETKVSQDHLTPEISLHLITPDCRLFSDPQVDDCKKIFPTDPFWGFYWPGGQAIARYVLDNPHIVEGKSVLDIGSGCGASSLAALMSQAKNVVANDIDEVSGFATLVNALLNHIKVNKLKINTSNLIDNDDIKEDVIFIGDLFYDQEIADILLPWCQRMRKRDKEIYIGDPGRFCFTSKSKDGVEILEKLATYELGENSCIENNGFKAVHVWRFK